MQELEYYLTERPHEGYVNGFREYYFNRKYLTLEQRKELIQSFSVRFKEGLTLSILHSLYQSEEERDYIVELLLNAKKSSDNLLPLFRENLLKEDERKKAVEKIKHSEHLIQTWFLYYGYNPTDEERDYILSHMPEERSHHDCYMYLAHNSKVSEEMREKALQSMLDRGILYYLKAMLKLPTTINPSWIPTESEKKRIQNRINELIEGSTLYKNQKIAKRDFEVVRKFKELISDNDDMYRSFYCVNIKKENETFCFPTGWVPSGGYEGASIDVRIKNGLVIEATLSN